MVSAETLFSYTDWKLPFIFHIDASDKQLGAVISQKEKSISFFSIILSKPQSNYNMSEKEILVIVECFKKIYRIVFGYEINAFSYHKNLVHAATLSESQRVVRWKIILKEFGPNIQHIAGVNNIVSDTISILPSTPSTSMRPVQGSIGFL